MLERVTLRVAQQDDLEFLFEVSTSAMREVVEQIHPGEKLDRVEELRKYKEKFNPQEIQVIQYDGQDVGRLRVVRKQDSIYVGGIQILPVFQGKGIGTTILQNLIGEAVRAGICVVLEVHDVNIRAQKFYKRLGFVQTEQQGNKKVLKTVIAR